MLGPKPTGLAATEKAILAEKSMPCVSTCTTDISEFLRGQQLVHTALSKPGPQPPHRAPSQARAPSQTRAPSVRHPLLALRHFPQFELVSCVYVAAAPECGVQEIVALTFPFIRNVY